MILNNLKPILCFIEPSTTNFDYTTIIGFCCFGIAALLLLLCVFKLKTYLDYDFNFRLDDDLNKAIKQDLDY